MKKDQLILFSFLIFVAGCASSSYQILEKSGKKPTWVSGAETNFIITSGIGTDAEEAKNECIKNIRDNIINSIAVNVRSKTEINIEQRNGKSDEKMKFTVVSQAANIPYLNGISLSKAKDYYWEKVENKKTRRIEVGYHVKYPFSNAELQSLIAEFDKQQQEIDNQIRYLAIATDTASFLESYGNIISQLNRLDNNLIDDRKEKVQALIGQVKNQLKSLNVEPLVNSAGQYSFRFKNKNKRLKAFSVPEFKSNCAKNMRFIPSDTAVSILYDGSLCKYTDNPSGKLVYTIGTEIFTHEFSIDMNANKVELSIENEIVWHKISDQGSQVTESSVEIPLTSKFSYPFIIKRIELKAGNAQPVAIENINLKNNKTGINSLNYNTKSLVNKSDYSSKGKAFPYLDVTIYYINVTTNQQTSVVLSNVKYSTDW